VYFLECMEYNVRMLFPSIETGTAMNARESENYVVSDLDRDVSYRGKNV
jgi:hypothetical protein